MVIASGTLFGYWGYRLFRERIQDHSGDLSVSWDKLMLKLQRAAPGTFFALFGSFLVGYTAWQGTQVGEGKLTRRLVSDVAEERSQGFKPVPTLHGGEGETSAIAGVTDSAAYDWSWFRLSPDEKNQIRNYGQININLSGTSGAPIIHEYGHVIGLYHENAVEEYQWYNLHGFRSGPVPYSSLMLVQHAANSLMVVSPSVIASDLLRKRDLPLSVGLANATIDLGDEASDKHLGSSQIVSSDEVRYRPTVLSRQRLATVG